MAPPKTLARSATVPVAGLPGVPSPAARGGQATMPAANRAQNSSVRRVSAASLASGLHPHHTNVIFAADVGREPEWLLGLLGKLPLIYSLLGATSMSAVFQACCPDQVFLTSQNRALEDLASASFPHTVLYFRRR